MEKCTRIKISGNEYPVRFDYTVLKEVSEKYKSIHKFELDLMGMESVGLNNDGDEILKVVKDPSISCIMFLLPKMINSALDYMDFDLVDEKQIIKEIDLNYIELAHILHEEMKKCFKSTVQVKKKYNPIPTKTKVKKI